MKRLRGGLVSKAHRLVSYSTLGSSVIKKTNSGFGVESVYRRLDSVDECRELQQLIDGLRFRVQLTYRAQGSGSRVQGPGSRDPGSRVQGPGSGV